MRVLIAPDKFKGTASAATIAETMALAVGERGHEASACPLADGGEGTLAALGGANRTTRVTGPLGDPVAANWRLRRHDAVIEMAEASGLDLVGGPEGNDALAASTAGTGELIEVAVDRGATHVIVAVGGSATTDGGWGAVEALFPAPRLRSVDLVVACDVTTRFVDAAEVFGPQKGASPAEVALLRRRLERLVDVYRTEYGIDVEALPGGGAAGGLAGGLAALGAELVPGFELVADTVGLGEEAAAADAVITGEGRFDVTSLAGKVVGGVLDIAAETDCPVLVVAGTRDRGIEPSGPVSVRALDERFGTEAARADPAGLGALVAAQWLDELG